MAEPIANDFSFIRQRMEEIKPTPKPAGTAATPAVHAAQSDQAVVGMTEEEWAEYARQCAGF